MPTFKPFQSWLARLSHSGPPLIIMGLAALSVVAAIPAVPAVTAVSILTLGATNAMLDRIRNSPSAIAALLLHTVTYGGLYALFVGATLNLAMATCGGAFGALPAADLAVSVLPVAASLHRVSTALRSGLEPQR